MKYPLKILANTNISEFLLTDQSYTNLVIDSKSNKVYTMEYDDAKDDFNNIDVSDDMMEGNWYIKMIFSKENEIEYQ